MPRENKVQQPSFNEAAMNSSRTGQFMNAEDLSLRGFNEAAMNSSRTAFYGLGGSATACKLQ